MRTPLRLFCTLTSIFSIVLMPGAYTLQAQAATTPLVNADAGFDPNNILTDNDIFDVSAMSYQNLENFLREKGVLATYRTPDIDGVPKTVPEIIWRVANSYKLNPKYLIALIQKEQSLVEDPNPSQAQFDWAAGYAVCDSCSKNDPSIQQFKGFASQIEWAAKQHREKYLIQLLSRGTTIGGQGSGKPAIIDGQTIVPANKATAMLYSYTPHIHGNLNLWRIWHRWFDVSYPDGTIVRGMPSQVTYMIRFGQKKPFASPAVVASIVNDAKIIQASDTSLAGIPNGDPIRFPQFALLRDPNGKLFMIVHNTKRHIQNTKVFRALGLNEDEIEDVSSKDLASYPDGEMITAASQYPQGLLVKTLREPGVWYVEDGVKHPIIDRVLLTLYFNGRRIKNVTQATLDGFTPGDPFQLRDGELVRTSTDPSVYVIENGLRRSIASADLFERVGWKWKNVVTIPDRVLSLHAPGSPFEQTRTTLATTE